MTGPRGTRTPHCALRCGYQAATVLWAACLSLVQAGCNSGPSRQPARGAGSGEPAPAAFTQSDSPVLFPDARVSPSTPDTYPLLLVNPGPLPVVIFADAGAGEVLLDTVRARDSTRVNVLIAADSVRLRAETANETPAGMAVVPLRRDSIVRWEAR